MKMKSCVAVILLALGISACSTLKKVVYRIDVPQGNYLEQENIDQLKIGMNQEQVRYLLGTSILEDSFVANRWTYVFIQRKGHEEPIQRTLFIYFDNNGIVNDIQLDKPL